MIKQTRRRRASIVMASLCLSTMLAGCASHSASSGRGMAAEFGGEWVSTGNRVVYLSREHSGQLAAAGPGQMLSLGSTPWGKETSMTLHQQYFSAAGNHCYSASVLASEDTTHSVNLCDYGRGIWGATRAIVPGVPAKRGMASFGWAK